jgi:hypothetical protein
MMRVPGKGLTKQEYFAMLAASENEGVQMTPRRMEPKVLGKVGHPNEPDCPTAKQRRARIDLFKKAISDLKRSGLPLKTQEQSEIAIREKIEREKTALLDKIAPNLGNVYKLGSKFYIKKEFVAEDGQKTHQYFQCEKNGVLRISSLPYFFSGSAAQASDFLRRNPGRYLVRDVDHQKYMLSSSDFDGRQTNLLINKYDCRVCGSSKSNTIDEVLAKLHQDGIFGYRKNLKYTDPLVFYSGTKEEADDFLWRYPGRYLIRDLGTRRLMVSYCNFDGSRVDVTVRKDSDGTANSVTVGATLQKLHQQGIRGYYKGLENVPPPVPRLVGIRRSEGADDDGPPPEVPLPF